MSVSNSYIWLDFCSIQLYIYTYWDRNHRYLKFDLLTIFNFRSILLLVILNLVNFIKQKKRNCISFIQSALPCLYIVIELCLLLCY